MAHTMLGNRTPLDTLLFSGKEHPASQEHPWVDDHGMVWLYVDTVYVADQSPDKVAGVCYKDYCSSLNKPSELLDLHQTAHRISRGWPNIGHATMNMTILGQDLGGRCMALQLPGVVTYVTVAVVCHRCESLQTISGIANHQMRKHLREAVGDPSMDPNTIGMPFVQDNIDIGTFATGADVNYPESAATFVYAVRFPVKSNGLRRYLERCIHAQLAGEWNTRFAQVGEFYLAESKENSYAWVLDKVRERWRAEGHRLLLDTENYTGRQKRSAMFENSKAIRAWNKLRNEYKLPGNGGQSNELHAMAMVGEYRFAMWTDHLRCSSAAQRRSEAAHAEFVAQDKWRGKRPATPGISYGQWLAIPVQHLHMPTRVTALAEYHFELKRHQHITPVFAEGCLMYRPETALPPPRIMITFDLEWLNTRNCDEFLETLHRRENKFPDTRTDMPHSMVVTKTFHTPGGSVQAIECAALTIESDYRQKVVCHVHDQIVRSLVHNVEMPLQSTNDGASVPQRMTQYRDYGNNPVLVLMHRGKKSELVRYIKEENQHVHDFDSDCDVMSMATAVKWHMERMHDKFTSLVNALHRALSSTCASLTNREDASLAIALSKSIVQWTSRQRQDVVQTILGFAQYLDPMVNDLSETLATLSGDAPCMHVLDHVGNVTREGLQLIATIRREMESERQQAKRGHIIGSGLSPQAYTMLQQQFPLLEEVLPEQQNVTKWCDLQQQVCTWLSQTIVAVCYTQYHAIQELLKCANCCLPAYASLWVAVLPMVDIETNMYGPIVDEQRPLYEPRGIDLPTRMPIVCVEDLEDFALYARYIITATPAGSICGHNISGFDIPAIFRGRLPFMNKDEPTFAEDWKIWTRCCSRILGYASSFKSEMFGSRDEESKKEKRGEAQMEGDTLYNMLAGFSLDERTRAEEAMNDNSEDDEKEASSAPASKSKSAASKLKKKQGNKKALTPDQVLQDTSRNFNEEFTWIGYLIVDTMLTQKWYTSDQKRDGFKLDRLAPRVLKDDRFGKVGIGGDKVSHTFFMDGNNTSILLYCLVDTLLPLLIAMQIRIVTDVMDMSALCQVDKIVGIQNSKQQAKALGMMNADLCFTVTSDRKIDNPNPVLTCSNPGGIVYKPKYPGKNMRIQPYLDFASMYPNIILSLLVCFTTMLTEEQVRSGKIPYEERTVQLILNDELFTDGDVWKAKRTTTKERTAKLRAQFQKQYPPTEARRRYEEERHEWRQRLRDAPSSEQAILHKSYELFVKERETLLAKTIEVKIYVHASKHTTFIPRICDTLIKERAAVRKEIKAVAKQIEPTMEKLKGLEKQFQGGERCAKCKHYLLSDEAVVSMGACGHTLHEHCAHVHNTQVCPTCLAWTPPMDTLMQVVAATDATIYRAIQALKDSIASSETTIIVLGVKQLNLKYFVNGVYGLFVTMLIYMSDARCGAIITVNGQSMNLACNRILADKYQGWRGVFELMLQTFTNPPDECRTDDDFGKAHEGMLYLLRRWCHYVRQQPCIEETAKEIEKQQCLKTNLVEYVASQDISVSNVDDILALTDAHMEDTAREHMSTSYGDTDSIVQDIPQLMYPPWCLAPERALLDINGDPGEPQTLAPTDDEMRAMLAWAFVLSWMAVCLLRTEPIFKGTPMVLEIEGLIICMLTRRNTKKRYVIRFIEHKHWRNHKNKVITKAMGFEVVKSDCGLLRQQLYAKLLSNDFYTRSAKQTLDIIDDFFIQILHASSLPMLGFHNDALCKETQCDCDGARDVYRYAENYSRKVRINENISTGLVQQHNATRAPKDYRDRFVVGGENITATPIIALMQSGLPLCPGTSEIFMTPFQQVLIPHPVRLPFTTYKTKHNTKVDLLHVETKKPKGYLTSSYMWDRYAMADRQLVQQRGNERWPVLAYGLYLTSWTMNPLLGMVSFIVDEATVIRRMHALMSLVEATQTRFTLKGQFAHRSMVKCAEVYYKEVARLERQHVAGQQQYVTQYYNKFPTAQK